MRKVEKQRQTRELNKLVKTAITKYSKTLHEDIDAKIEEIDNKVDEHLDNNASMNRELDSNIDSRIRSTCHGMSTQISALMESNTSVETAATELTKRTEKNEKKMKKMKKKLKEVEEAMQKRLHVMEVNMQAEITRMFEAKYHNITSKEMERMRFAPKRTLSLTSTSYSRSSKLPRLDT